MISYDLYNLALKKALKLEISQYEQECKKKKPQGLNSKNVTTISSFLVKETGGNLKSFKREE